MKRIVLVAAVVMVACTAKAGGEQVEKKIVEIYAGQGLTVTKATCPKAIEVKVNSSFLCQTTFDNGETFTVNATITKKTGSTFEYAINIVDPVFVTDKMEKMITDGLTEQLSAPKSVSCGPPGLHHSPADHKMLCDAVDSTGFTARVQVSFDDKGVATRWEIVK